jgi:hypothetical protein
VSATTTGNDPPASAKPLVEAVKTMSQRSSWRRARAGRYAAPLGTRETSRKIANSAESVPMLGSA